MKYLYLVKYYKRLEATTKKLEKKDILSELYKKCNDLSQVVLLSMGIVYSAGQKELGIAREIIRKVVGKTYGIQEKRVVEKFKETGDLGTTAEFFSRKRSQSSPVKKELTVNHVFENLRKLPYISGKGSQEIKMSLVSELLSQSSPEESKYIIRTILGDMRIGVAGGIVRDAISDAFEKDPKDVEKLFDVIGDYGKVAEFVKKGKMKAEVKLFKPVRVMLAERGSNLKEALEKFPQPAIETKYDGFRIQIHRKDDEIKIFSRRLENVTKQFPDIVSKFRKSIKGKNYVIEGEVISIDEKFNPKQFQNLSRRIQRKYDIDKIIKEVPVQVNLFDMIFFEEDLMNQPLKNRWDLLQKIFDQTKSIKLAEHIQTSDLKKAEKFYEKSLADGQEGVIVKNLDAPYKSGRRVGYWIKIKPVMENLDLTIVGAEWGEGKRANFMGSFILAAYNSREKKFAETTRIASGLVEKENENLPTMEELTKKLKKEIISENGKIVKLKPKIVVEIAYEEIQKSPKYDSGYAFRFPRIIRIRDDKHPEDSNTVNDIEKLFKQQKRK